MARSSKVAWLLVAVCGLVVPGGCGSSEAAPVAAAKRFAHAANQRDVDTVLTLVESTTRERIERSAEVASDQVGGRRQIAPREMFQIVGWERRFKVAEAELVSESKTTARVKLTGPGDQVAFVDLVREDGWRVRIPTPESVERSDAD